MKTYREYAKKNGHNDEWIDNRVRGLFGPEARMKPIEYTDQHILYDMGMGFVLFSNASSADTVELLDEDGAVIESWILD